MKCVRTNNRNNVLKISFQGDLETKNVASAHALLSKAFRKTFSRVVVTLNDCEKCDFAFIQLLVMIKIHVEDKGIDVAWDLNFAGEDAGLLTRLNLLHLLETKTLSNESTSS